MITKEIHRNARDHLGGQSTTQFHNICSENLLIWIFFTFSEESKTFADDCFKGDRTCADDYILLPHLSCALQSLYFYFSSLIPTLRLKCHILKAHKSPLIVWEPIILRLTYHLFWNTFELHLKGKTEYHTDLEDALGSNISI